jgi:phosphoglycerate dehydrogenase-like enzyme
MTDAESKAPRLVVAIDFSDALMQQIRDLAPNYRVERHFPDVPENVWADTEILYTMNRFPTPEQAPRLRWIQLHYAGVERTLSNPIVKAEDIEVTSASGIHATPIAEYTLGMMLAFNLRLPLMMQNKASATWPENRHEIFVPKPLREQTVGIAGYGSIGREIARMAQQGFGMRVLASKRDAKHPEDTGYNEPGLGDPSGDIPERIYPAEALASMARECDYLVIVTPLTEATRHSVNEEVLNSMKKTAVIINVGRGGVIDEKALISALAADKIAGAALDVFEEEPLPAGSPLWNLDNVIISPHTSGNNASYNQKAGALFIENLKRYLEKKPLYNRVEREQGY